MLLTQDNITTLKAAANIKNKLPQQRIPNSRCRVSHVRIYPSFLCMYLRGIVCFCDEVGAQIADAHGLLLHYSILDMIVLLSLYFLNYLIM